MVKTKKAKTPKYKKKRSRAPPLKRLGFGGSYPIRAGRMGGGGPYFITQDAPKDTPKDISVQLPPKFIDMAEEYLKFAREGLRTAQQGINTGSSALDLAKKAAPFVATGATTSLLTAYALAPNLTTDLATTVGTNIGTGAVNTAANVVVNVATNTAKTVTNAVVDTTKTAATKAASVTKEMLQVPANYLPNAQQTINWSTGMGLASWMVYAGMGLLTGGNVPPALIPP